MSKNVLNDQVIIITGASRGIGYATAYLLAQKGAKVVLASRNIEALRKAANTIKSNYGTCTYVPTNIQQENDVKNLVSQVIKHFGRIDILINNAGIGVYGPITQTTLYDWEQVMGTNLKGIFLCTKEVIPIMIREGSGHIINIASQAGKYGFPNLAIYCASKFGVIGFSESLKRELAPYNIKVSYLCPGYVDTDFLKIFPKEIINKVKKALPDEIATQIFHLITDEKDKHNYVRDLKNIIRRLF